MMREYNDNVMAIKITRWRPDTCDCELEYEWDDSQSEDVRTHTISNVLKACPAHAGEPDKVKHYNNVLGENQRKNIVFGKILESVPTATRDKLQEDGSTVKDLKLGKEYKWSFDAQRNLVIDLVGFTAGEKLEVKTLSDNLFPNKVKIK